MIPFINVRCQPNCQSNSEKLKHIQNQILQKRYFLWQIFQVDHCHKMIIFNNRQQFDICDGHNSNHLAIECSSIHSLSTHDFNQCLFTGFNTKAFNIASSQKRKKGGERVQYVKVVRDKECCNQADHCRQQLCYNNLK